MSTIRNTAVAGLLGLTLTTPALHAAAVGDAMHQTEPCCVVVTDIQVSWADSTHEFIRVTWQEVTGVPEYNVVWAYRVKDGGAVSDQVEVAADAPNEALIPLGFLGGQGVLRVAVNAESSVEFDTTQPPAAVITSAVGGYGESATLTWRAGDEQPDTTPGDPLDLLQVAPLHRLGWRYAGEAGWAPIGEFSEATTATGMPSLPERRTYQLAY